MTNEEILELTMDKVEARMLEIKSLVEDKSSEADFEALSAEVDLLEARKAFLVEEQRKADILAVANGAGEDAKITITEEKSMSTLKEIRSSQEYSEAFAEYIKTGNDKECRKLLTELASSDNGDNVVPVPSFVEDEIRTAWENSEILSRVRKSYVKGVLRVGFELSASDAAVHAEGDKEPDEEELILGIITLTPASIKKWITISDEAIDLKGEAFLRYIYDELVHKISEAIENAIVALILNAPASSDEDEIGVPVVESDPAAITVTTALGFLTSKASAPVVIMNRGSYKNFKAVQYSGNFVVDIFEGLPVLFSDALDAFDDADEEEVYMIVGDLSGVQANFPNGEGVTIKYDDLSLAEKDLVKVVGREYVALGITSPKFLVKVAKAKAES